MSNAADTDLSETIDESVWFGIDDADRIDDDARASVAAEVARIGGLVVFPAVARAALADGTPREERDRVVGAAVMALFGTAGGLAGVVREHCVGTAAVCRVLGEALALPGAGDLFLAGLLHDVGKLLLLETHTFDYLHLPAESLAQPNAVHGLERAALGYDHAVLGAAMLRTWSLPEPIPAIVAWHHQPIRAYAAGGAIASQVSVLRLADVIAWFMARTTSLHGKFVRHLERSPDAEWLSLPAARIGYLWSRMAHARDAALATFDPAACSRTH